MSGGTEQVRAAAAGGLKAAVLRAVLVLYLLALGAPVLAASGTAAEVEALRVVELCTAHGVRRVAVDDPGNPPDERSPRHPLHDCPGCLVVCAKLAAPGATAPALPAPAPTATLWAPASDGHLAPRRPSARAPLPPRGPPLAS